MLLECWKRRKLFSQNGTNWEFVNKCTECIHRNTSCHFQSELMVQICTVHSFISVSEEWEARSVRQRKRETWFRHGPISTMHRNQAIIVIELNRFSFSIEWAQFRDQSITYNTDQQQQRETSLRTENHLAASFFLSFTNHIPWFYWVYNMKNSSFCHIRHRRLQQWRHRFRRRSEEEAKNSTAEYKRVMKTTKRETIRNVTPLSGYINRPIHRSLGMKFRFSSFMWN